MEHSIDYRKVNASNKCEMKYHRLNARLAGLASIRIMIRIRVKRIGIGVNAAIGGDGAVPCAAGCVRRQA